MTRGDTEKRIEQMKLEKSAPAMKAIIEYFLDQFAGYDFTCGQQTAMEDAEDLIRELNNG